MEIAPVAVQQQQQQQPAVASVTAASSEPPRPLSYKNAVDNNRGADAGAQSSQKVQQQSQQPSHHQQASQQQQSQQDAGEASSEPYLRLRGLPWDAKDEDIRNFFVGLSIVEITWTFTHRNRPSGEAYVTFANAADAAKGLQHDKQMLGKRYIEVFQSTAAQLEAAKEHRKTDSGGSEVPSTGSRKEGGKKGNKGASDATSDGGSNNNNNNGYHSGESSAANEKDTVVMMYGLPYSVSVTEIEQFFAGYNFVPGSVIIDSGAAGKGVGTGQISFEKHIDALKALHDRNRKFIGKRYVSLHFPNRKGQPFPPLPK